MKQRLFVALLALILLPSARAVAAPQSSPALNQFFVRLKAGKPQKVVAYGTSLTRYGYWVTAMQNWFNQQYPGLVTVINNGGPGQGSDWGVVQLKSQVLDQNPDLVLLEFGYNDAHTRKQISVEQSKANQEAMVHAIQAQNPKAAIVLQTMNAPWDSDKGFKAATDRPKIADYMRVVRDVAAENKLPLVDNYPVWGELEQREPARVHAMIPDGSHPNKDGSLAVNWPALQALLESGQRGG